nr:MAG TPA: hypothetical protein [Caudoviricetes sp.]
MLDSKRVCGCSCRNMTDKFYKWLCALIASGKAEF